MKKLQVLQGVRRLQIVKIMMIMVSSLLILGSCNRSEVPDQKPNVLFIAIDDLNDWIEPLGGHPQTITPNLSRLADQGLIFTNASCASPACVPSRAAMFKGILASNSGYYDNLCGDYRTDSSMVNIKTLTSYFADNGYFTAGAGKITHHYDTASWDEYFTKPYWINPWPEWYEGFNGNRVREWVPVDASKEEMTDWQITDWVIDQLKKDHEDPFFLGCGIFRPHEPWFVPHEYYDKFDPDTLVLPKVKLDDMDDVGTSVRTKNSVAEGCIADTSLWQQGIRGYLASINFADECLGKVLDALEESKYRDNTIIILWSDHGWHLGEKFNWSKFKLWEESARCVLMCYAPGITTPGTRCSTPVNLVDMFPTLIDLCKLPDKDGLDGISFIPQLVDPETKRSTPTITANPEGFSLRTERYRYIWYYDGSEELYDHQTDPDEWNNLASSDSYKDVIVEFKKYVPESPAPRRNVRELRKKGLL